MPSLRFRFNTWFTLYVLYSLSLNLSLIVSLNLFTSPHV